MAHMNYGAGGGDACADGSCGGAARIVAYVATGAEDPAGFDVAIGAELAGADYHVGFFGAEGAAWVPQFDFPNGVGDRTTTTFRVMFSGEALNTGDVFNFQIVEG